MRGIIETLRRRPKEKDLSPKEQIFWYLESKQRKIDRKTILYESDLQEQAQLQRTHELIQQGIVNSGLAQSVIADLSAYNILPPELSINIERAKQNQEQLRRTAKVILYIQEGLLEL